ncbi:copper homeostasis periplasmic binding protein CopC [Pseudoduganella sp. UC29_106]|uniref:copper homeostasis periplasmic binding protein CopC n=1 Tax=Pseudoduganella sp. UC29_106 TaxID=3374553 RepID=UPI003756A59D
MKRFVTGLLLSAVAPLVFAHATVKQSIPAAGATLDKAPQQIVLTFNEKVEPAFSSIELKDFSGKAVGESKAFVDSADPVLLKLDLPSLAAGSYQVNWVAVGPDGHRRKGSYSFTVK